MRIVRIAFFTILAASVPGYFHFSCAFSHLKLAFLSLITPIFIFIFIFTLVVLPHFVCVEDSQPISVSGGEMSTPICGEMSGPVTFVDRRERGALFRRPLGWGEGAFDGRT